MWRLNPRLGLGIVMVIFMALPAAVGAAGVYDDLIHAVNNDDERTVAELLKRGVDVNSVGPNGDSLLMLAARHGRPPMVKLVLDAQPRVNARNAYGETALMVATFRGHTDVVRQLLARGAEVNHPGWTPLSYAAAQNRMDIARILMSQGAQINAQAENGTTALMMAAYEGHLSMVLLLMEHGADLALRNRDGQTALGLARAREHREISELLRRAGGVE
jgi:ankyrin repeat protein